MGYLHRQKGNKECNGTNHGDTELQPTSYIKLYAATNPMNSARGGPMQFLLTTGSKLGPEKIGQYEMLFGPVTPLVSTSQNVCNLWLDGSA